MASRRTRIKGIAHIPQRKKNQENDLSTDSSSKDNISGNECIIEVLKEENQNNELTHHTEVNHDVNLASIKELPPITQNDIEVTSEKPINSHAHKSNSVECLKNNKVAQSSNTPNLEVTRITDTKSENLSNKASSELETTPLVEIKDVECPNENQTLKINVPRRKFLKPGINLNAVKKRASTKEVTENLPNIHNTTLPKEVVKQENFDRCEENTSKSSEKVVVISEIRIAQENKLAPVASDITKLVSIKSNGSSLDHGSSYSEVTLNETYLGVSNTPVLKSSVVTFSPNIKQIIPETHNASDSEYPPPPPSPSKINRSRIKAIPRLSQRKTSCSASESEDETRKYGRIRNNSVCSIVSTNCLEPPTPTTETVPPPMMDVKPTLPKKINRTEQSRKLAEARREFHKRFGANNPDKQQLKMIDLIFYNPSSNPMSKKPAKTDSDKGETEKECEESVDDPSKVNVIEEKENDAESGMPVPQIKIGPSGEIILDEQSLIVENAEVVRQKEQLQNSQIVNGDFDTGYGIYKRVRRALSWSQKETVRFYKAINLIGTDFTVMLQLFPKRTRRELKMKFKKEEKINKQLIDRAIMQPCNYNFADLKREIQIEEEEDAALQKLKDEELEKRQAQMDKFMKKRLKREKRNAESSENLPIDINSTENTDENLTHDDDNNKIILPPKKRLKLEKPFKLKSQPRKVKSKPLTITSVLDDSDADISDMETQTESEEEETIPYLKPTRSGRMPKSTERYTTIVDPAPKQYSYEKKKFANSDDASTTQSSNSINTFTLESKPQQSATRDSRSSSLESNSDRLVPGAVVIMMEEDPVTGISQYRVFMVTPEKKLESLNLPSEIVARLIKEKKEEDYTEFLEPAVPEKNVTIPAAEEKDTFKTEDVIFIDCPEADTVNNQ